MYVNRKCCMISWRCMQAVHETQNKLHSATLQCEQPEKRIKKVQTKLFHRPANACHTSYTFFYIKSPDSPDVLLPSIFCTRMQLHAVTFKPRIKTWQRWQNWQNWVRTSKMDSMYASTGSSPARLEQLLSCWCWPPNNMVLMQCRVRISRNIEILEISWNTPATQAVILQNPSNTQFVDVEAWSVWPADDTLVTKIARFVTRSVPFPWHLPGHLNFKIIHSSGIPSWSLHVCCSMLVDTLIPMFWDVVIAVIISDNAVRDLASESSAVVEDLRMSETCHERSSKEVVDEAWRSMTKFRKFRKSVNFREPGEPAVKDMIEAWSRHGQHSQGQLTLILHKVHVSTPCRLKLTWQWWIHSRE